jgi:hypothetical protein
MELENALHHLRSEREKLIQVIAQLEELQKDGYGPAAVDLSVMIHRRGRKSMGAEERRLVSERMKNYWASRRKR